jgi:methionyl-tRNA synthetase
MDESFIACPSCGSVVRRDEVRGNCRVCGGKSCIACFRVCDECLKITCQNCIKTMEVWINGNLYLRKMCDFCVSVYPRIVR